MLYSIFDLAEASPDKWIREEDLDSEKQKKELRDLGGVIKLCSRCGLFSHPKVPCPCGVLVLQRPDGLFWGGENGWVEDGRQHAEHFFNYDTAAKVAATVSPECEPISMFIIETGAKGKE